MQSFIKLATYLFHPLWMPTMGVGLYLLSAPVVFGNSFVRVYLLLTIVFTVIIPLLFLLLLRYFKLIESFQLSNVNERRLPLLFFTTLAAFVVNYVFTLELNKFLFFFFSGIFFSGLAATLLVFVRYKVSLHMISIGGLAAFVIAYQLSIHQIEILLLASFVFVIGWIASSRLYLKAHSLGELMLGFVIGVAPQLYFARIWI